MIDRETILALSRRIAEEYRPVRIILFGSYAYGAPNPDSDVDLLVILPFEGHALRQAAEMLRRLNPRIPVDLLVRTPEEVRRRLALNDFFLREVVEKGRVLYECPDERVA